jgi:antitoxin component HigA of HigAB toxin-antitoxin module
MSIKPILNDDDYTEVIEQIRDLMDAQLGTPEGRKLETLVALIETYEGVREEYEHTISELRNVLRVTLNWTLSPKDREWVEMVLDKHTP